MNDHALNFKDRSQARLNDGILARDTIEFYHALFRYRQDEHDRYGKEARMPEVRPSDLPIAQKGHDVIVNDVARALIAPGLNPLIGLLSHHHPGLNFMSFKDSFSENNAIMDDFLDPLLNGDSVRMEQLAHQYKISADEAVFVMINWLNPYFMLLREKLHEAIPDGTIAHLCPFCGCYPDMSAISADKEGKRYLHCSLCEHEWPYRRIACAVCGSDDAERLEFLSVESEPQYRIDLCRVCEGYIKTVRLDKFEVKGACDLAVENILTPHLDSAAIKAGFKRP